MTAGSSGGGSGSTTTTTAAASTGSSALRHLRAIVAVGLKHEFAPWWPLPLPPQLPQSTNKHTLVLDIDETLLHTYGMSAHAPSSSHASAQQQQHEGSNSSGGGAGGVHVPLVDYHVLLRPHVGTFLREVSELFEVVFWTAGTASYCAAVLGALECDVLQLPPSFYHYTEMTKEAAAAAAPQPQSLSLQNMLADRSRHRLSSHVATRTRQVHGIDSKDDDDKSSSCSSNSNSSTRHANFYALSRSQTLQRLAYMKFLPMLGRPLQRVLMVDDNVRSFPLHPRHGVRVSPFDVDDEVMQRYLHAVARAQQQQEQQQGNDAKVHLDAQLLDDLQRGSAELSRLDADTALLDILPVLRAVAANVPADGDVTRELDYWRDDDYVQCDSFADTMNRHSVVRQRVLGATVRQRRTAPIAALRNGHPGNLRHVEFARGEMQAYFMQEHPSKL